MMMLDILMFVGLSIIGAVCFWVGFQVGRLTNRK
jgi:hypothetical protein